MFSSFKRLKEKVKNQESMEEEAPPKTENAIKSPSTFTEQLLVGLLNDIFSHCVFLSANGGKTEVVPLVESTKKGDQLTYMLALRWTKGNVDLQFISHKFKICKEIYGPYGYALIHHDPSQYANSEPKYGEVAQYLSVGLTAGLKSNMRRPKDCSKVSISLIKNYLHKDLYKGGIWAFLSAPTFLEQVTDENKAKLQKRTSKLMEIAKEELGLMNDLTIISLLWSAYMLNVYIQLRSVLEILCNEFLEFYSKDVSKLVHVLYLSEKMEILPHKKISSYISGLNNIAILENLSPEDLVTLVNVSKESDLSVVQKITLILYEYVDIIEPEFAVYLLFGLVNSKFDFGKNDLFTKRLLIRLMDIFEGIPVRLFITFFNSLILMSFDTLPYFNCIIHKSLRMLHLVNRKELILIGCSYAMSHSTSKTLKSGGSRNTNEEGPKSKDIYDCLEQLIKKSAMNHKPNNMEILSTIYKYLASGPDAANSKSNAEYKSMEIYNRKRIKTKFDGSIDALNLSAHDNSYKIFFSNLMEDCCRNFGELDSKSVDAILFALLTLNIDIGYFYHVMLVEKGEILRKKNDPIQIEVIDPGNPKYGEQFQMAKDIMEYIRKKEGISEQPTMEVVPKTEEEEVCSVKTEDSQPTKELKSEDGFLQRAESLLNSGDVVRLHDVVEILRISPDSSLSPGNPSYDVIHSLLRASTGLNKDIYEQGSVVTINDSDVTPGNRILDRLGIKRNEWIQVHSRRLYRKCPINAKDVSSGRKSQSLDISEKRPMNLEVVYRIRKKSRSRVELVKQRLQITCSYTKI